MRRKETQFEIIKIIGLRKDLMFWVLTEEVWLIVQCLLIGGL